jgi:hypothetical protein
MATWWGPIPKMLSKFAKTYPPSALKGAILLLRIKRQADDLIAPAMGLCWRWHFPFPSPWSHTLLITDAYNSDMSTIGMLECTIRTKDQPPQVDWKANLCDNLGEPVDQQGGIYAGHVSDYCNHKQVTLAGIKFLRHISDEKRNAIVAAAMALYNSRPKYHYDIPGLGRCLERFMSRDTKMPKGRKGLLICSAFCQAAYMMADPTFQFAPKKGNFLAVPPDLAIDDDLWFSKLGEPFPPEVKWNRKDVAAARKRAVKSATDIAKGRM